jgi:serine/threonine-protein kinase
VLAGSGIAAAPTIVSRPRAVAPPAPPPYRPPTPYYDYEEPPPSRRIWPWLLALLAVLVLGVAGFLLYNQIQDQLNANKPVAVPDVRLLEESLAKQQIEAVGLNTRVKHQASFGVPPGDVARQSPEAGDRIPKDSTVTLWISTGKPRVTVPDLKGHPLTDAISQLADSGLSPKIRYIHSDAPEDTVTAQSPAAGDRVIKGSKVTINVSKGPRPIQVPDVTRQPYANAAGALKGAGFNVSRVDIESDEPKGIVLAEDPPAGTPVPKGTKITLSVSKGPAESQVPDVTFQSQADAEKLLRGAGFKITVVTQDVTDPGEDGIVLNQDPPGGTVAKPGATVTVSVGKLVSPTTTETVPTTTASP